MTKHKEKNQFNELTQEEKNKIIKKYGALINTHINHYAVGSLRYFREDIEQEGWLYVFRHWKNFDPLKAQRSTWIYNTFKLGCKNSVHKEYGKQRRQAVNLIEEGAYDRNDDFMEVEDVVKQLPDEYRQIVVDKVYNNLSAKEITKKHKLFGKNKTYKQIMSEVEELLLQQ